MEIAVIPIIYGVALTGVAFLIMLFIRHGLSTRGCDANLPLAVGLGIFAGIIATLSGSGVTSMIARFYGTDYVWRLSPFLGLPKAVIFLLPVFIVIRNSYRQTPSSLTIAVTSYVAGYFLTQTGISGMFQGIYLHGRGELQQLAYQAVTQMGFIPIQSLILGIVTGHFAASLIRYGRIWALALGIAALSLIVLLKGYASNAAPYLYLPERTDRNFGDLAGFLVAMTAILDLMLLIVSGLVLWKAWPKDRQTLPYARYFWAGMGLLHGIAGVIAAYANLVRFPESQVFKDNPLSVFVRIASAEYWIMLFGASLGAFFLAIRLSKTRRQIPASP